MIEAHLVSCLHCVRRAEENLRSIRENGRAHLGHISTDDLERYHLGYMTDALTITGIEQHISECRDCADRMLATERFIYLVRTGAIREDSLPTSPGWGLNAPQQPLTVWLHCCRQTSRSHDTKPPNRRFVSTPHE